MAARRNPSRVTAPGAQRLTLTGIMVVPDAFARLRLLLVRRRPDGTLDDSRGRLQALVPRLHVGYSVPYEFTADEEDCGTVWVVPPAHRRDHWLGVAAALRGQWVTVEATVRPFRFAGGRAAAAAAAVHQHGVSLDLAMLTPLASEAPPARGEAPPARGEAPPARGEAPLARGEAPP